MKGDFAVAKKRQSDDAPFQEGSLGRFRISRLIIIPATVPLMPPPGMLLAYLPASRGIMAGDYSVLFYKFYYFIKCRRAAMPYHWLRFECKDAAD